MDEIIRIAEIKINAILEELGIEKDIELGKLKTTSDGVGGGQPKEHIKD